MGGELPLLSSFVPALCTTLETPTQRRTGRLQMDEDAFKLLLDPAVLLRASYLGASALILVIQAVPALRTRFLAYGSRATSPSSEPPATKQSSSAIDRLLDYLASVSVPHNYFTHFYVVSVLCSLFWGKQLWHVFGPSVDVIGSMSSSQVQLLWLLMLLQGVRRLVESYTYTSTSKSRMWFGHWILGFFFYVAVNMALWVEAAPSFDPHLEDSDVAVGMGQRGYCGFSEAQRLQWRLTMLPPAILTCHWLQHTYHAYLYRLRTQNQEYQLPSHPIIFPNLLCPHYTLEVMIYLLLSLLAAPTGRVVNWTLASATVFVAVNLGVTASGTKKWYAQRFGVEKVAGRRRMIPWVW